MPKKTLEISTNTFFTEHIWTTASNLIKVVRVTLCKSNTLLLYHIKGTLMQI